MPDYRYMYIEERHWIISTMESHHIAFKSILSFFEPRGKLAADMRHTYGKTTYKFS